MNVSLLKLNNLHFLGNVDVTFRNGFPVVSVPLPSRRENCEFILKPLSHTVKDFVQQLKDEDKGIDEHVFCQSTHVLFFPDDFTYATLLANRGNSTNERMLFSILVAYWLSDCSITQ